MSIYALMMVGLLGAAESAVGARDEKEGLPAVTIRQAQRESKYPAGLTTYIEGLALAMLGRCSVDRDADKQEWSQALKVDHVRIIYARPRPVGVTSSERGQAKDEVLSVSELVLPMSVEKYPDHIFVRCGGRYRAFAKYSPQTAELLQEFLKWAKQERS